MNIEDKVFRTIIQYGMITRGDKVLAAVSGGADSVCMLNILSKLREPLGFELFCAHLNHGLRGKAADEDERFVLDLCKKTGIIAYSAKADVSAFAQKHGLTTEEAGRKVRYNFFEELAQKYGFNKIATAHNKNDNAETVLMRIIRGTGIDGLSGISYVRSDGVIRPILDISRKEVEEYCSINGIEFCTDATNAENDYTRNKIRNELIPYLEKEFNPGVSESLVRLADNANDDGAFLTGYAEGLYGRLKNPINMGQAIALHVKSLEMVEKSISARVIRLAAADAANGIKLEKKHIEDIFELMNKKTGTAIDLPQGLKAKISYGWIVFEGTARVKTDDGEFFVEIIPEQTVYIDCIGRGIELRIEKADGFKCKADELAADMEKIGNQPLFLRSRRNGDRIVWFPDGREKKIKNVFIDEKIPKCDRNKFPLLCTGNEVIAITGRRVSEKYKATKDTERVLVIKYEIIGES